MINPMDLSDKIILVTGASSGIGRETSLLLSQLGAKIIISGRNEIELEKTKAMLEGSGHIIENIDLSSIVEHIPSWIKELASKYGSIDGLVHSAGIQFTKPIRIIIPESTEELIRINVTVALLLAKGFRQKGVCNLKSSIVFLSSVMGIVGQAGQTAYAASKSALIGMTKSLAIELSRENIRVNCVVPAIVKTAMSEKMFKNLTEEQIIKIEAMHPLGLGMPRDVANAIAFLLADTGRWITGTTLVVDGGYTAQ